MRDAELHDRIARVLFPHAFQLDAEGRPRCPCGDKWVGTFDDHLADVLADAGLEFAKQPAAT